MTRKIMLVEITPPAVTALAYQIVADIPNGKVGVPLTGQLGAKGGAGNYSFVGSSLPPGVSVAADGKVSGTPTTAGFYEYTATVTDDAFVSRTQTFAISIGSAVVVKAFFPAAEQGLAYSVTLLASGGTGPYTWSTLSGTLPAGLTRTGDTISGTPTTPGTYIFTIRATDAGGKTGDYAAQMLVAAPVSLAGTFPDGIVGVSYSVQLAATDSVPPYSYALTTGTLNAGLTLSPGGLIFGVPTAVESQALDFTVTDALGGTDTLSVTLATVVPGGGGGGTTENRSIDSFFQSNGLPLVGTITGQAAWIPYDFTIIGWHLGGDGLIGSGIVDVQSSTTQASWASITAAAKPTVSTARNASSSTLTGWTTVFTGGIWLRVVGSGFVLWKSATLNLEVSTP